MHNNICSKCGQTFETKNPKRIVCPNCLYLDKAASPSVPPAPRPPMGQGLPPGGGYGAPPRQGGYGGGGYGQRPDGQGFPPRGPGGPPRGPGGPPRGPGGFNRGPGGPPRGPGGFNRGPGGPPRRGPGGPRKQLLIPKEVLAQIEMEYRAMLPLPNPDAHVKIGEKLDLDPKKAFFGINLIRQKMKLPKLEFPKRPLAVTPDQLTAVQALYENFLPLPPIGIHKIIAKQLKMDEWRVHVAIKLIRNQQGLNRWNEERDDLPAKMKAEIEAAKKAKAAEEKAAEKAAAKKPAAKKAEPAPDKPEA